MAPVQIVGGPGGYSLLGEFATDIAHFERHVAAGEHSAAERLVRGEPLHDLADDLGAAADRARLAGAVRAARHRRLLDAVYGASPLDAVPELESLVVADPHDERWWALLMRAQYRCGMQAEALRTFQRVRHVLADELGLEPGPELRDLEREILTGAAAFVVEPAEPGRAAAMPARLSSFVGRRDDLLALTGAIDTHRLVTLVGPGGTGKTTTALEVVRRAETGVPHSWRSHSCRTAMRSCVPWRGRSVCPMPSQRHPAVRRWPPIRSSGSPPPSPTPTTILIVDNCEHVIDVIAPIVHRLLVECPNVRVVATSRSSLTIPGEHVYPLAPLPVDEAVELFVARAGDHAATAAVEGMPRDDLIGLCERLDRLPLAIELAAARLRSMTLDELSKRLDDRFGVLTTGPAPSSLGSRHCEQWSTGATTWLGPAEQVVFRRMAVFVGGASADAVEFVAAGGLDATIPQHEVLSIVDHLLDKSLVRAVRLPGGTRYLMLQTLHDYAAQRLAESGEREAVLVRHAQYYADLISGAGGGLVGPEQRRWLDLIRLERDNIEAARAPRRSPARTPSWRSSWWRRSAGSST